MEVAPAGYVLERSLALRIEPAIVLSAVADVRQLPRWLIGVDRVDVEVDGGERSFRLVFGPGRGSPGTFHGENVSVVPGEVVRSYRLPAAADPGGAYRRTVSYTIQHDVHQLQCRVDTTIAGMNERLAERAARVEQLSLDRSLERLSALVGNGQLQLVSRWKRSVGGTPL